MKLPWTIRTMAKNERRLQVHNGCEGSPNCAMEVRIYTDSGDYPWQEAHLNREEAKQLRKAIKQALKGEW